MRDEITSIEVIGDVAMVRCVSDYASSGGSSQARITILRVWHKRGGKWQVVAFQATPMTISS